ncbi:MAG: ankyrin repeat domain-containing protein [Spirochaetales bacterium]|nr:ankyrin repeat domain-containing protein [Spirochaetales bacterium]
MPREFKSDDVIAKKYSILSKIASGGMGTTYLARDNKTQKNVVVKVLNFSEASNWEMLELFHNECNVLKTLDHPFIPDYVEHLKITEKNQETYILVQEYIEGKNLRDMIKEGRVFTERECINILKSMLGILSYIHNLKPALVHRDINPKNIIMDNQGRVFLVDFGTAGLMVKDALMAENTFAGTIGYIPPEQMYGKALPASDIFALGLTIIYLLTGTEPSSLPIQNLKLNYRKFMDRDNESLYSLLDAMIEPDPDKRVGDADELLSILNTRVKVLSEEEEKKQQKKVLITNTVKIALFSLLMCAVFLLNKYFPFIEYLDTIKIMELSEETALNLSYFFPLCIIIPYVIFSLFFKIRIQSQKSMTLKAMTALLLSGLVLNFMAMIIEIPFYIYILYSSLSISLTTLYLGRWKPAAWIESALVFIFMFFFSYIGLYMINFFIWVLIIMLAIAFNYKKVNRIIRAVCITVLISLSVVSSVFIGILSGDPSELPLIKNYPVIKDLNLPFHLGGMVNIRFTDEDTPLHLAVENEHTQLIKLLLHKGADINFINLDGETPLYSAVEKSKPRIVKLLISYGIDVDYRVQQDAMTALQEAVGYCDKGDQIKRLEIVNLLLDAGADISVEDWRGANLLHLTSAYGNIEILRFLLQKDFDVQSSDGNGSTPLHYAADGYFTTTLEFLLAHGADINAVNDKNETPLFNAVYRENIELTEYLIKNGAQGNIRNTEGNTPLTIAEEYEDPHLASLLRSALK